ncbi:septum formation family protein [Nocardioides sp. GY 10127]|uniref:septum formation family protein n=1 Tax=Nocardioides sp. GY 10127 TaxID=2569762 RepID=UPI001F0D9AD5|nr:septum formation family protein [Nocardioides sp. GY 10127]
MLGLVTAAALLLPLTACSLGAGAGDSSGALQLEAPSVGACRQLTAADIAADSNSSATVDCSSRHTAETFASGELPARLADDAADSEQVSLWVHTRCTTRFEKHLGADESTAMRTILSWVWFRPTDEEWAAGARWFRCDLVGGGPQLDGYRSLPESTKGLLATPDDVWMLCVDGETLESGQQVDCSSEHTWRAVTTIKVVPYPDTPYPGDATVESTTKDYCEESVDAWLGYPDDFDYAYTWFGQDAWAQGNRRSVCWAETST